MPTVEVERVEVFDIRDDPAKRTVEYQLAFPDLAELSFKLKQSAQRVADAIQRVLNQAQ